MIDLPEDSVESAAALSADDAAEVGSSESVTIVNSQSSDANEAPDDGAGPVAGDSAGPEEAGPDDNRAGGDDGAARSHDDGAVSDGSSSGDAISSDDGGSDDGGSGDDGESGESGSDDDESDDDDRAITGNLDTGNLDTGDSGPISEESPEEEEAPRQWYILKVQSNREDSIRDALARRVKVEGLDDYFGEIIVPTETVTEFKAGKKKVVKRKLYPGYIVVNMVINDDTWFLVRETPGIGDFTGAAGKPSPMLPHEVDRIVVKEKADEEAAPTFNIAFGSGDRVKITEGTFENFEGDVDTIDSANGRVTVMINIFGRSTPVELEYWQLEAV